MNTRELEYFVTIAKKGNLSAAAEELYVSQPTLSKFIDRLEAEVDNKLFQRVNRSMKLTYAGQQYLEYAKKILMIKHDLDVEMNMIKQKDKGFVTIGMPTVRSSLDLGAILPRFKEMFPNVELKIVDGDSNQLDILLQNGEIDIAFYYQSNLSSNLKYEVLATDEMHAVFSKDSLLQNCVVNTPDGPGIKFTDLKNCPFILQRKGNRHYQYVDFIIQKYGLSDVEIHEGNSLITANITANSGYGVSFLSSGFCKILDPIYHFNHYRLIDVDDPLYYVAGMRKNSIETPYIKYLIALMKDRVNQTI